MAFPNHSDVESSDESYENWSEYGECPDQSEYSDDDVSETEDHFHPADILAAKLFINTESIDTRVKIFEGSQQDKQFQFLWQFFHDGDYDDGNIGPYCHLCNEVICPDEERCVLEGIQYNISWEKDIREDKKDCGNRKDDLEVGILQCCFCFNVFHRFNCSLTMSKTSYLNLKRTRQWSCPLCVKEFVPLVVKPKVCKSITFNLSKILGRVLPVLKKHDPIEFCCKKVARQFFEMFTMDLNFLYELG